ncbi:hypothetical protein SERLA73DRAFT_149051 [Serpula lacrymans var. lacrymans S7.3]|uniref:Uncharacterized protein n=1 Tax=Serpula lacrymans var. lacrymans (strain S7.3) TaxID=936435 RepID=F8PI33_SERL3|nr:hypothetical protein SERLA73DRAFT_149051 [Serpula lacrymans var. lacrymans S7.3]
MEGNAGELLTDVPHGITRIVLEHACQYHPLILSYEDFLASGSSAVTIAYHAFHLAVQTLVGSGNCQFPKAPKHLLILIEQVLNLESDNYLQSPDLVLILAKLTKYTGRGHPRTTLRDCANPYNPFISNVLNPSVIISIAAIAKVILQCRFNTGLSDICDHTDEDIDHEIQVNITTLTRRLQEKLKDAQFHYKFMDNFLASS